MNKIITQMTEMIAMETSEEHVYESTVHNTLKMCQN